MKSDKLLLALLLLGILCFMLFWALFVINGTVGLHPALNTIGGTGKFQIESLGQFGASFGVLAALFAGFAVVMLGYSIRVQQKELTQLKKQMEYDRDIREYTWLIDSFTNAKSRLENNMCNTMARYSSGEKYGVNHDHIIKNNKYISSEANNYIRKRKRGDLNNSNNKQYFIESYQDNSGKIEYLLEPFDTYLASIKQIAAFIDKADKKITYKYLNMFASVTNKHDIIIIHEQTILRDDSLMIELLQSTGLLGVHGTGLYEEMSGAHRLDKSAFGIKE